MTLYMPLFRSCSTLRPLTQLHAHLLVTGLHRDPLASTKLIESYGQMGSLQSSRLVFETYPCPDSFMWGVLIKCCLWNHLFEEVVSLYHHMISQQTQISGFVFPSILRASSGFGDLSIGRKIHGRMVKSGFDADSVVETSLLSLYGELGCLDDARKVFDGMGDRDVVSWSSIILSYVENKQAREGLEMFRWMIFEGIVPDSVTMLSIAEACAQVGCLRLAKSVHGHVFRKEIEADVNLSNSFIVMYSQCGYLYTAEKLFQNINNQSISSWTAMISSYNQSGCFQEAVRTFIEMQESNVEISAVTMMGILYSCARLGWLKEGKSVHCFLLRKAMDSGLDFLGPALIDLYAECWKTRNCEIILHLSGEKNVVSWNMLISFYVREGLFKEALVLFVQMLTEGLIPDSFSLASSLSACASVGSVQLGHQIHCHTMKRGFLDEYVQNSLIDMYCKSGFVDLAFMIFDRIKQRSVVTWNCMMCGFSQNGNSVEAISLFDQIYFNRLEVNDVTFLSAIQACSNLGYLEKGKWIHHKLVTYGVRKDLYIDTALIDMYAKSGDLRTARRLFDCMSERSVVSWTTVIGAYGMHGQKSAAISLFNQMVESGINPNEITFMNVLSACSHAGSVEEGKLYFNSMREFGVEPQTEHFASVVDLLSRAGDLTGAYDIIKSMSRPVDASVWAALLNGCRIHRRMDMIKSIERELTEISTDDTGYYTLLSNIYAEGGNWNEFGKVRSMMKVIGINKVPGHSTIEIDKRIYRFGAGDTSNCQTEEIYIFLEKFRSLAQEQGCGVERSSSMIDTSMFSKGYNVQKLQKEASNCMRNE
ncbi:putative Pentatricopeptide repeat-containing protein [Quillaja saponaria]|uniref:Pentatricopeptide repeat-containing protein n=1 Tax=Quillaja saponaria TaxID=32244 RepID=A0AAD7P611_QUISA|nr:putative Pentatricopeptide repeat-containing protein [Quillaja saponaria]